MQARSVCSRRHLFIYLSLWTIAGIVFFANMATHTMFHTGPPDITYNHDVTQSSQIRGILIGQML